MLFAEIVCGLIFALSLNYMYFFISNSDIWLWIFKGSLDQLDSVTLAGIVQEVHGVLSLLTLVMKLWAIPVSVQQMELVENVNQDSIVQQDLVNQYSARKVSSENTDVYFM